ncbi:hypothetical protein CL633_02700 [bacterium]|nr:hypothetical protein [bacterium]|tara:strand:+ start:906 stop:1250 length:345 start_codon:yes stop_codon:yes gene_type:complete
MAKKISQKFVKKIAKDYIGILKKDGLNIPQAFIFGSQANGQAGKYSDIDICVVSEDFKNRIQAGAYLNKKLYESDILDKTNANVNFDLIGYPLKDFVDDSPLVWEIKKHGIRVA